MVGVMIPIALEGGGKGTRKQNITSPRRGSGSFGKKPNQKKSLRQTPKTIKIEIQLEAATSEGTKERSFETKKRPPVSLKKTVNIPATKYVENCRKSAVAGRDGANVTKPENIRKSSDVRAIPKVFSRRQSNSKDLGLGQGSAGIKKVMNRRKSSSKDLLGLDQRRKSCGKVVIRRDSVNGLRIITENKEDNDDGGDKEQNEVNDAILRLSAISLKEFDEFSKFERDALKVHNKYRKLHGVPLLALSKDLCDAAEEYAIHLARRNTFSHSGDPVYGENLYWSWSSDPGWVLTGDEPVDSWYEERKGYDYGREPRDTEAGHFTQLVWAKSLHLGVGLAKSSSSGKYIVVMKYDPAGNYLGQYRNNVARPGGFGAKKKRF